MADALYPGLSGGCVTLYVTYLSDLSAIPKVGFPTLHAHLL